MADGFFMTLEEHGRLMSLLASRNEEIDLKGARLREAKSEIARHHDLIVELRNGLGWALDVIDAFVPAETLDVVCGAVIEWRHFLNREVG